MTKVSALWLAKVIACHSLTGLNIIIFHDGLFNISHCPYNQQEKLENNYKTSIWKSQQFFFKKRTYANAMTPLPLFVFVCFSMMPSPLPSTNVLFEWLPRIPGWSDLESFINSNNCQQLKKPQISKSFFKDQLTRTEKTSLPIAKKTDSFF